MNNIEKIIDAFSDTYLEEILPEDKQFLKLFYSKAVNIAISIINSRNISFGKEVAKKGSSKEFILNTDSNEIICKKIICKITYILWEKKQNERVTELL